MLSESRALRLLVAVDLVATKAAQLAEAKRARNQTMRNLMLLGSSPSDIAHVAGMSRERVYQIKTAR